MGSINLGSNGAITNLSSASGAYDNDLKSDIALLGFYRAADNSKTKYNLTNQVIDEFNDSTGIDASASTNEYVSGGAIWGGGNNYPTGGTVTTYTGYRVHSFTSTGNTNFVVPASGTVDALIVAGGGGGGSYGGGGAGGFRTSAGASVTAQTYTITVGTGGAAFQSGTNAKFGANGVDSSALGITSTGGGGGGGNSYTSPSNAGKDGGSGGGGGTDHVDVLAAGSGNTPSTSPSQGNNGGAGVTAHPSYTGGGGGGAGGAGGTPSTYTGGAGGAGAQNNYRTGSNQYYAAGGGGSGSQSGGSGGTGGAAGSSIGGKGGGTGNASDDPTAPTANTGSGGGAEDDAAKATAGAAGIVVIRYADTEFATATNLTLVSTAQTASSAPETADFHVLIENTSGTAELDTDIKAYVSRDDGSNWTDLPLTDEGTWGTNRKVLAAHDKAITSASGTAVRYKITTHNQSIGTKQTKVHATSLGWK